MIPINMQHPTCTCTVYVYIYVCGDFVTCTFSFSSHLQGQSCTCTCTCPSCTGAFPFLYCAFPVHQSIFAHKLCNNSVTVTDGFVDYMHSRQLAFVHQCILFKHRTLQSILVTTAVHSALSFAKKKVEHSVTVCTSKFRKVERIRTQTSSAQSNHLVTHTYRITHVFLSHHFRLQATTLYIVHVQLLLYGYHLWLAMYMYVLAISWFTSSPMQALGNVYLLHKRVEPVFLWDFESEGGQFV